MTHSPRMLAGLICGVLLSLVPVAAHAQQPHPSGFPIDQRLVLVAIDGQAVTERQSTMRIALAGNGNPGAVGNGGCRGFVGQMGGLGRGTITFEVLGKTAVIRDLGPCTPEYEATEAKFFAALEGASRWELDGTALVIRGDRGTLRMVPDK